MMLYRISNPCPMIKCRHHNTNAIASLIATSSALVELQVLILCLDDMFTGHPHPKDRHALVLVIFVIGMYRK